MLFDTPIWYKVNIKLSNFSHDTSIETDIKKCQLTLHNGFLRRLSSMGVLQRKLG